MKSAKLGRLVILMLCVSSLTAAAPARRLRVVAGSPAPGAQRLALVIGNASYAQPLKNPVEDARAMAVLLKDLGFTVMKEEDLGPAQMEVAIRQFGDLLKKQRGVGLFYYAGHGVQVNGENYLIPVGVQFQREDEVREKAINAGLVLNKMDSAQNETNIVILDACRDNPFRSYWRSQQTGLATMNAPIGTYISYSAGPGQVAGDGAGQHGVYTEYLLREMRTAGAPIEQVFKRVRQSVAKETRSKQVPWDASSLQGDFYFVPPSAAVQTEVPKTSGAVAREVKPPIAASSAPVGPAKGLSRSERRAAMVVIPAGTYMMGTPRRQNGRFDDEQQHEVKLSRGFWIGQTEVTQGQWERVMGSNPSFYKGTDLPVETVSWLDAVKYCNRLSNAEGLAECYRIEGEKVEWVGAPRCGGYRLPTEAEWEYAARAGQSTAYAGSDNLDAVAWYDKNSAGKTHPVGKKVANGWGLYDMSGNVCEWVWDWNADYPGGTILDPMGSWSGSTRVARGGSWDQRDQPARVAYRGSGEPGNGLRNRGFRLVRSLP